MPGTFSENARDDAQCLPLSWLSRACALPPLLSWQVALGSLRIDSLSDLPYAKQKHGDVKDDAQSQEHSPFGVRQIRINWQK
jgi:hypothetical protein